MSAPFGTGNHALQDYQMQLKLLEQQNKKRSMMARQGQDDMTLHRNDRSLLEPRVPHRPQSHLRHGLPTPRSSPTNRNVLTPSNCPSPEASMSNVPAMDPSLTGQIYNAPSCQPSTEVSNPPPHVHYEPFHCSTNTYTPRSEYSFEYQEYQYSQNPQTKPFLTANVLGSHAFTPVTIVPEVSASSEPNLGYPFNQFDLFGSMELIKPAGRPMELSSSNGSSNSIDSTDSGESSESMISIQSTGSLESMDSSKTYDTLDLEVLTPGGQWDELPGLENSSGFESNFTASTDYDFNSDNSFFAKPDFVKNFLTGYNETCPWPLLATNEDLYLSTTTSSESNLNYLPTQVLKDRKLDTNTKLYPVEPAETPPKKTLRSSGLSDVLQECEQGGYQPKSLANENGTERRDHQVAVSQSFGFASKRHCNEDIMSSIEALPLPCATKSVINTSPRQNLTHDQRQPSSPSPFFGSSSETCSWFSDNETDWGDDESDDAHQTIGARVIEGSNISGEQELPTLVARPILSKMKQELVDRIMVEFWQIFNQEKANDIYENTISRSSSSQQRQAQHTTHGDQQNTAPASKSSIQPDVQVNGTRPTAGQNRKRERQRQDEDENDESEKRNPKRPKGLLSPPRSQDDTSKFACPYRKHDAKRYCVRHWRSCALTPLETVARVKGHLYRHHRIFPCQRCKKVFNDQQGVNDHLMEPEGCKLLDVVQQDGITTEMVERLRSKKKAHRDQSEEDRWKEIYEILFPGELVPSPCKLFFEEIQEDVIQSPDSRDLADYEEYCRRELPRVFRASLEEIVNSNTQPLEEQLRSQLMDLIRDAQDRVFSRYRSSSTTTGTSARGALSSSPQTNTSSSSSQGFATSPLRSEPTTIASLEGRSQARLPSFCQPPSPKTHLESGLDISDPNITPSKPDRNDRSDSGYDSSPLVMPSTLPLTPGESSVNTSASSSQISLPSQWSQETTGHAHIDTVLTQTKLDSNSEAITSAEDDHLNSEPYLSQNTIDFELDYADLSNFDMNGEFGNCDFSQNLEGFL